MNATPERLYRGIRIDLGNEKPDFDQASPGEQRTMLLARTDLTIMHWTTSEDFAREWATRSTDLDEPDRVHAVITIRHPGSEYVECDPDTLTRHGVGTYAGAHREQEVPLTASGPRDVIAVQWWRYSRNPYTELPDEGEWIAL